MILFSVIIPTYNRAYLISETINTVLLQTYKNFELIIVDDGSTDNTEKIIEEKFSSEKRIKYFYKKNEERGAARNFGLKNAKGDYAVFFDSDDMMKPHYLESLNSIIEKNENIFLLATHYDYFNNGKIETHPEFARLSEGWYTRINFLQGNFLACNYCIKIKDSSYSLFPEERELTTMEDWLFLLTNLQKKKIFIGKEICISMRQHNERSMMENRKVIAARKKATEWVITNLDLTVSEKKKLKAWSLYFCSIHEYLDHNRVASLKEVLGAIKTGGINKKFIFLFIKVLVGRKIIQLIR
jgi:glycosyltransferase involved in cell wall biosynthesis